MSTGVCLPALEVHLCNICPGCSVIASVKSRREEGQERRERPMEGYKGKESYKKSLKEGELWWETQGGGEGPQFSRGGCQKVLHVGFNPSDRTLGSCSVNISVIRAWSIYHSVSNAVFHSSVIHPSNTFKSVNVFCTGQGSESLACKRSCSSTHNPQLPGAAKRWNNSISAGFEKFPTAINEQRSTSLA